MATARGGEASAAAAAPPGRPLGASGHVAVAALLSGTANMVTGYPFDTMKVLQQAHPAPKPPTIALLGRLLRAHGGDPRFLFRGLPAPLVGGAVENAVNYVVYDALTWYLERKEPAEASILRAVLPASVGAALVLSPILGPVELIKIRAQISSRAKQSSKVYEAKAGTTWGLVRGIWRTEGAWRGFTRGLGATYLREIPGNTIYFVSYETVRRALVSISSPSPSSSSSSSSSWSSSSSSSDSFSFSRAVLSGGLAGICMWSVVLPLDIIKTRIQMRSGATSAATWLDEVRVLWRREGPRGFYAGWRPVMVRAFPANAAQWAVLEGGRRWLGSGERKEEKKG